MISVIIPVYNETRALPHTLDALLRQGGEFETIVVDGGSTDTTPAISCSYPGIRFLRADKGRATQMNAGAAQAKGEWLLFLHADTLLPAGAIARLQALEVHDECQAGGFRQSFSGNDWRLRLISWLHNKRCELTRIFYGDQAMFVRRRLFMQLGGFPAVSVLEDLKFCEKLVCVTSPVLLGEYVVTASRKFVKMGILRSFGRVVLILLCHELRLPIPARKFFNDVR